MTVTRPVAPAFHYQYAAAEERAQPNRSDTTVERLDQLAEVARPHPARLWQRRTPGYRLAEQSTNPRGYTSVARPHRFGNWYQVGRRDTPNGLGVSWVVLGPDHQVLRWPGTEQEARQDAVDRYRQDIADGAITLDEIVSKLQGKDLACYCRPGQPCHAFVLLTLANEDYTCDCEHCAPTPEEAAVAAEVARQHQPGGKFYTGPLTEAEYQAAERALGHPIPRPEAPC